MKNKKRSKSNQHETFVSPMTTVNMDEIALLTDDELALMLNDLQGQRDSALRSNSTLIYQCEVEICYVKRELQIRKMHHQMHQKYEGVEIEAGIIDEEDLPVSDFDNTPYVQAWLQWNSRTRDFDEFN